MDLVVVNVGSFPSAKAASNPSLLHSHADFFCVSRINPSKQRTPRNYKHEKYSQIPTISFQIKKHIAFPKILNWSSFREIPSHQGSRSMTCSNTTKPCPLVVELNQPTPLKNMRSLQIGWKFPFQGENLLKKLKPHLVLPKNFALDSKRLSLSLSVFVVLLIFDSCFVSHQLTRSFPLDMYKTTRFNQPWRNHRLSLTSPPTPRLEPTLFQLLHELLTQLNLKR